MFLTDQSISLFAKARASKTPSLFWKAYNVQVVILFFFPPLFSLVGG